MLTIILLNVPCISGVTQALSTWKVQKHSPASARGVLAARVVHAAYNYDDLNIESELRYENIEDTLVHTLYAMSLSRNASQCPRLRFEAVAGFFQHDQEPEGPGFRAITQPGLGLQNPGLESGEIDTLGQRWQTFLDTLGQLNEGGTARYKLFYIIRHGEGFHNVKEAQVGRVEWEVCALQQWAQLDGDDTTTWFDAYLTDKGKRQALEISTYLNESSAQINLPLPQRYYTSPLARCLETTWLALSGLEHRDGRATAKTVVKEDLRERLGVHTCNKRRTRKWIEEKYPSYQLDDGFAEEDEIWHSDIRESLGDHVQRITRLLHDIFENDEATIISLTAHSLTIRALYSATGHRQVWVNAGALVPVLIKAEPHN